MERGDVSRRLHYLLITFSLIGLGAMVYLPLELSNTVANSCNINSYLNCGTVANSQYSSFFGVHIYIYGWVFFSLMLGLTLWHYFVKGKKIRRAAFYSLFAISALGVVGAVYLIYVELFLIGAVCPMCTIAHACIFTMFGLCAYMFRTSAHD